MHGKEKQWEKERVNTEISTPAHNFEDQRTRHFSLARMPEDKNGKRHVPPGLAGVVDELAYYNERMANGTWVPPPGEDVLSQVIREHGGRTIAVGSHVGYKKGIPGYVRKQRKNRENKEIKEKYNESLMEMEERNKQNLVEIEERSRQREMEIEERYRKREIQQEQRHKQRDAELKDTFMKMMEDKLSNVQTRKPLITPEDSPDVRSSASASNLKEACIAPCTNGSSEITQGPRKCILYVPNDMNKIRCATGMVHSSRTLHGCAIISWCVKVQVDGFEVKYKDLDLPLPPDAEPDVVKLGQARSYFIQWPRQYVNLLKTKTGNKLVSTALPKEKTTMATRKKVELQAVLKQLVTRPSFMQNFYTGLMRRANPIMVKVNPDIFFSKEPFEYGIQHDDLLLMLTNGWLDCGIVAFYAMCLHNQLVARHTRQNQCMFLNPYKIQDHACTTDPVNVERYLCHTIPPNTCKKSYFILPYFEQNHWSLFIFAPSRGLAFILDSKNKKKEKTELSYKLAEIVIKCLGDKLKWIFANCNQQEDSWECGYYIMRWMYEFVISQPHDLLKEIPWKDRRPYAQKDIDNIVGEWISQFIKFSG